MSETKQPKSVAIGGLLGIAVVTIIGIAFSSIIQRLIPENFVVILSGLIFIFLGIMGLFFDEDDVGEVESEVRTQKKNAFYQSALLIGLAEFGDKSQIFVISTALIGNPIAVFLGAVLGMTIIMLLTMIFGQRLLQVVPEEQLHRIASILFIIVGIWILVI